MDSKGRSCSLGGLLGLYAPRRSRYANLALYRARSPGSHLVAAWGVAAAFASVLPSPSAAAQPLPKLVVRRTPDALDCPNAAALAAAVERQMKRPALEPVAGASLAPMPAPTPESAPAPTPESAPALVPAPAPAPGPGNEPPPSAGPFGIDVQVVRGSEGYTATVQAGGRFRQIMDPGPTCAGLAEGLAITLAILLDSEAEPPAPPPPEPEPVAPKPPAPEPARPPAPPRRQRTKLSIHAGIGETAGLIGPLNVAFGGDVDLRILPVFSLGAGALWIPTRSIDFAPGRVEVYLATGFLRACVDVLGAGASASASDSARLAVCLLPAAGAIHGAGFDYVTTDSAAKFWFGVGVGALVEGPIWKRLGWAARINVMIPVTRESFLVDGQTAFRPALVGVAASIGPKLSIW